MGLSSLPAPSEGVLSVVLVNAVVSISIFKKIFRSILHAVGIHVPTPFDFDEDAGSELPELRSFPEELRCRVPPSARFRSLSREPAAEQECSVCLTRFEPESDVNRLECGHFFHKGCLERWLQYWNITCPMCRAPLAREEESYCSWF